jgi:magnesium-transporting ATPase (P-type)
MLTGTLPALAFAYDSHHSVSKNKRHNSIFSFKIKFLALGIGTISSALLFGLYYVLTIIISDITIARVIIFTCSATYALTIAYSFKNLDQGIWEYNPFSNIRLNFAVLIGLMLIIATVTLPLLERVFNTVTLPLQYVWIVVIWNIFNIAIIEITKFVIGKWTEK